MASTLSVQENDAELIYTDSATGTVITVVKDADNVDVRQVTPIAYAKGQTWETLKTYLHSKTEIT